MSLIFRFANLNVPQTKYVYLLASKKDRYLARGIGALNKMRGKINNTSFEVLFIFL
jgi:hypothetical protein